jgi:hypothetical protein
MLEFGSQFTNVYDVKIFKRNRLANKVKMDDDVCLCFYFYPSITERRIEVMEMQSIFHTM